MVTADNRQLTWHLTNRLTSNDKQRYSKRPLIERKIVIKLLSDYLPARVYTATLHLAFIIVNRVTSF